MEQIETRLRLSIIRERQDLRAKYLVFTLLMSEVLRPKSSICIVGMNLARKVTPSHGGIGL